MADKVEDSEHELDLELDVSFNEFEDECQLEAQNSTQHGYKQDYSSKNQIELNENKTRSDVCATFRHELSNVQSSNYKLKSQKSRSSQLNELDDKEDELLKSGDTFDSPTVDILQRRGNEITQKNIITEESVLTKGESFKRKCDVLEEGSAMDIDEDGLLDSEDETQLISEKKLEEDECKSQTGINDPLKKVLRPTRGGRKKKDRRLKHLKQRIQHERLIRPVIGRLFSPLTADEHDTDECLARQLADRLEEEKDDLILRVVKILGHKKAIEIFQETRQIQKNGGMLTSDEYRLRTSGGIFLYIMKNRGHASKEQVKEIYAEEREKEKQLLKERKQREKEFEEREIQDLRELLAKKREMLSKMETENKIET